MAVTSRAARLCLAAIVLATACSSPATALPSVDPADGVTIENASSSSTTVVYERPDGGTEDIVELQPGSSVVVDLFSERNAPCRTGRLFARSADGTEIDELYVVCKGKSWTIGPT